MLAPRVERWESAEALLKHQSYDFHYLKFALGRINKRRSVATLWAPALAVVLYTESCLWESLCCSRSAGVSLAALTVGHVQPRWDA